MSRCDYEGTFYRVFCVGLLVIAFTFTVILTNVFIDIDSLLSKREQEFEDNQAYLEHATENSFEDEPEIPGLHEYMTGGDRNYDDGEGTYRTKRSLDSTDFLLHIQNPKMRNKLTNRLATLLEELDEEESTVGRKDKDETKIDIDDIYVKVDKHKRKEVNQINKVKQENNQTKRKTSDATENIDQNYKPQNKDDNSLHSAMHNLLVQGIKGHMDLNDVYKNLHAVVRNFKKEERSKKESNEYYRNVNDQNVNVETKELSMQSTTPLNEESKFFEELTNCNKLQQDIQETDKEIKREKSRPSTTTVKSPKFVIRTFIDIEKTDKESNTNSKENMKGIVKVIYNGRSIKVKSMDDYESTNKVSQVETTTLTTTTTNINRDVEELADIVKENYNNKQLPRLDMKRMFHEYLAKYKKGNDIPELQTKRKEKRLKRNVKVAFEKEPDKKKKKKKDDDELFVEIETHFDKRGIKGQKKKEMVQKLIEKIQHALHSIHEEQNQPKHVHIKKRMQDPLGLINDTHHNVLIKKIMAPHDPAPYTHRELYPISKAVPYQELLPKLADKNGEDWKQQALGPKFFSTSKSINSAEIGEVNVDYAKLLHLNGIPQRLQLPLNTDVSDENNNAFFDLGNLQFLIKDLEGSGFSIGLNQYVDSAPDTESMKIFTGLEKLVKTYHQNYDQNDVLSDNQDVAVFRHEMKKRDININSHDKNIIKNREVRDTDKTNTLFVKNDHDYHSNEYRNMFSNHFLPFNNYQQVYEGNRKEVLLTINRDDDGKVKETPVKELPNDLNQLFDQKLKPSEILSLADLLERKKRSYNVKKITNLKTKIHLNRYLNTNAMPKQRILMKNKRNKRQIDKIRIVAKDVQGRSDSNENIYIFSDENTYADRAVMRRMNIPNTEVDENKATEQLDEPIQFETSKPPLFNALEDKIRRNPLMSKYPHVFLDDMVDTDYTDSTPTIFGKVSTKPPERNPVNEVQMSTDDDRTAEPMPKVQDLVNALVPYPKTSYKVTVKLLPRDLNETNLGFKEVHTSINKTFNRNGMLYSSMVNVSEISKIENNDNLKSLSPVQNDLRMKHDAITTMLKEHKDRIDKQLNNLKMEKQKIDTIIQNKSHGVTREKNNDLMDIILPSDPPKLLHLSKDDIGKLLISFIKEQEVKTTTEAATTTTPKPVATTTTHKPEVMDPMKMKLLRAITQNEQLTSQILNKIDQNTGILETYLGKITEKIQTIPDVTRQAIMDSQKKVSPHEIVNVKIPNSHPIYVRGPFNQTSDGVPFIYAYQQPYKQPNKTDSPVASIVYNEYNPNTVQKNFAKKTSSGDLSVFGNEDTRYFIDEEYFKAFLTPADAIKSGIDMRKNAKIVRSGDDKHKSPDKVQNVATQAYNPVEMQQNIVAYNAAQNPSSNNVIASPLSLKSMPPQNVTRTS